VRTEIEPRARELLSRPIVGQLGYLGLDGEPKVNPTWFRLVDAEIQVASPPNAFKSRSLRRDPRAVLTVSTLDYPYQIASATGQVSIEILEEEPRIAFVRDIASHYLRPAEADDYLEKWLKGGSPGPGDLLRLHITRARFTDTAG
jgi:hypothetical protein